MKSSHLSPLNSHHNTSRRQEFMDWLRAGTQAAQDLCCSGVVEPAMENGDTLGRVRGFLLRDSNRG